MTLRQIISEENLNGKKSIKTVTVTDLANDTKTVVPIYQGHVYSALKRKLSYDDFHGEVVCFGRSSPRSANVDITIAGKKQEQIQETVTEYDICMLKYANVYA